MAADLDPIAEAHRQWMRHGWSEAADGMAVVTSVMRVQQLLMERIDAVLRPLNLTFARYEILRLLAFTRSGSMPMSRMGSLLQVHPTSVTSAVDKLQSQGFVDRQRSEDDRRLILASITADGHAVVDVATAGLNRAVFESVGLGDTDLAHLTNLLTAVRAHEGDHVGEPMKDPVA